MEPLTRVRFLAAIHFTSQRRALAATQVAIWSLRAPPNLEETPARNWRRHGPRKRRLPPRRVRLSMEPCSMWTPVLLQSPLGTQPKPMEGSISLVLPFTSLYFELQRRFYVQDRTMGPLNIYRHAALPLAFLATSVSASLRCFLPWHRRRIENYLFRLADGIHYWLRRPVGRTVARINITNMLRTFSLPPLSQETLRAPERFGESAIRVVRSSVRSSTKPLGSSIANRVLQSTQVIKTFVDRWKSWNLRNS